MRRLVNRSDDEINKMGSDAFFELIETHLDINSEDYENRKRQT